jgi:phenylpropionate dioxygenase-like ring-hydroxylating dioxygenase large terminal subunit
MSEGRLTCPYHGWQYDRTGRCVHIPALPAGSPIPRKARATMYQAREAWGLVWVALEEPVAPIPGWPKEEWTDPAYRGFVSSYYEWKTSAGRAVENFMDFSHFPFVHDGLLGSRDRTVVEPHDIHPTEYGLWYAFEQEEPSTLHSAENELVRWEYYLYAPFVIHLKKITPAGEATLISLAASPTSSRITRMWIWILRNHSFDSEDSGFTEFTDTIMEQDRVIVEGQRPEQIPTDLREELHLKVPDAAGIALRRMLGEIEQIEAFGP